MAKQRSRKKQKKYKYTVSSLLVKARLAPSEQAGDVMILIVSFLCIAASAYIVLQAPGI